MPTYRNSGTIALAAPDANEDHDFIFRSPGSWKVTIAGTYGSRTLAAKDVGSAGDEVGLKDEAGVALTAIAANKSFVISSNRLRLTTAGTGAANIQVDAIKLW